MRSASQGFRRAHQPVVKALGVAPVGVGAAPLEGAPELDRLACNLVTGGIDLELVDGAVDADQQFRTVGQGDRVEHCGAAAQRVEGGIVLLDFDHAFVEEIVL